ncbi:Type IV pilus biogenesis protein PilO [Sandaracinus amylolyticus]|uniref:Type IV pilus biogenesis protein PilO n=1 Tax=Sandaracinus amylolyticus TaxID=927083 RepID=A0A0F6W632_9BACT|nr:Type IV pilus biogenesis protein PilO [Sandaracinus amylolyticus]
MKVMLAVFIVAILGAIYYFALHTPMEEAIANEQGRFGQLQNDMREAEERQREFIRLREEVASREGLDRANMRVLPEQAEIAAFLQDLNRLAETSGLQMRLVEPRPEEPDTHYVRLPVALRVRGRYHQLARFFYNVSRLERAISMENIELSDPTVSGEDVVLDVGVLATTYRRPTEPAAAPEGAASAPQGG